MQYLNHIISILFIFSVIKLLINRRVEVIYLDKWPRDQILNVDNEAFLYHYEPSNEGNNIFLLQVYKVNGYLEWQREIRVNAEGNEQEDGKHA